MEFESPLYDWKAMEKDGFSWWIRRIKRAQNLYDEFRIDHFRGFAGFWAVPSGRLLWNTVIRLHNMFLCFVHCAKCCKFTEAKIATVGRWKVRLIIWQVPFSLYFDIIVSSSIVSFMTVGRAWKIFIWCHIQSCWEDQHICRRSGMFLWINMYWNHGDILNAHCIVMWFLVLVLISFFFWTFRLTTLGFGNYILSHKLKRLKTCHQLIITPFV